MIENSILKVRHQHQGAIDILRKEMCRIGGELFEAEFVKIALKQQATAGSKEAAKELSMVDFMEKMFAGGASLETDKEQLFGKLLKSMLILSADK